MSQVMKAIKLTQLENELVDVRRQIKKLEGVISSVHVAYKFKKAAKDLLPKLVRKQNELANQITEESLLDVD